MPGEIHTAEPSDRDPKRFARHWREGRIIGGLVEFSVNIANRVVDRFDPPEESQSPTDDHKNGKET